MLPAPSNLLTPPDPARVLSSPPLPSPPNQRASSAQRSEGDAGDSHTRGPVPFPFWAAAVSLSCLRVGSVSFLSACAKGSHLPAPLESSRPWCLLVKLSSFRQVLILCRAPRLLSAKVPPPDPAPCPAWVSPLLSQNPGDKNKSANPAPPPPLPSHPLLSRSSAQGIENPVFEEVPSGSAEPRPRPQLSYMASRQPSESGRHLLSEPGTPLSPSGPGDCFFPTLGE